MPLLIDAPTALRKHGMSTIGDHVDHMTNALEASTAVVENLLGTPLAEAQRIDWHSYVPSRLGKRQGEFREVKFLLKAGFVQEDITPLLYATKSSIDFAPVLEDASNADLLVEDLDYFINYEEGSYTLLRAQTVGTGGLMVKYTSGFGLDSSQVLTGTPDWLVQAGAAAAIRWMLAMQSKWNNKERVDLTPEVASIFRFHLNEHIRTKYGEFPIRSKVL
jgi:hypothetical protein